MNASPDRPLIVRIHAAGGTLSELWDTNTPLSVGHPLRWVLEFLKTPERLRLTDTRSSLRVEQAVTGSASAGDGLLAEFPLGTSGRIAIYRENAAGFSSVTTNEELGSSLHETQFRRSAIRSVALLGAALLILPLIRPGSRELITRAPVQVVDLSKLAQAAAKPKARGGSGGVASRLRALVSGSRSRWLSRSPASTLSGRFSEKYAANFGNMASAPSLGLSALGKSGYSGSLGSAGSSGGTAGRNWVDLDSLAATVEEGLTRDEVGQVIHKHMKEIRYCYETAMIRSPDLEGKLVVEFTIGRQGAVRSSGVRTSSVPDQRLDDCVLSRLVAWKFPQPKGGIEVAVTYPFIFKSLGK